MTAPGATVASRRSSEPSAAPLHRNERSFLHSADARNSRDRIEPLNRPAWNELGRLVDHGSRSSEVPEIVSMRACQLAGAESVALQGSGGGASVWSVLVADSSRPSPAMRWRGLCTRPADPQVRRLVLARSATRDPAKAIALRLGVGCRGCQPGVRARTPRQRAQDRCGYRP